MKSNILIVFIFFVSVSYSQVVTMSNSNVNDCDFTFYDTGGVNASGYSANQDFTTTICPDAANQAIVMTWFTFTLGTGDVMKIYDGNSTAATLLGSYTNNDLNNITAYATINNPTGCLTLHFTSDGTDNGVFNASVKCEIPCAYPVAGVSIPTNTLFQVCKGTTVNFDGAGSYPQSGFTIDNYHWDFGDQTEENNAGTTTAHTFNNTGRYVVSLEVEDNNGCINKNAAFIEVIVESEPIFTMEGLEACEGEIFCLPAASVISPPLPPPANDLFGQGIHIPDDVGSCFQATQFFNVFPVGSHLSNINDLQSIYANMGHTYIGDLIISIICPSGQSVVMHQQGGGGKDLGGDYYWDPVTTNPTWAGAGGGGTLAPGTYSSVNNLNGLVGCELNGTWTLQICDMWAQDEGDVFGWGVNLNPALYVDLGALSPTIGTNSDSSIVSGPGMTSLSADGNTICAQHTTAGTYDYTYTVTNSFGCVHDTTVSAIVKPGPIVDFDFDSICIETTAEFTNLTQGSTNLFTYTWNFGDGSPTELASDVTHDYTAVGFYNVELIADAGNGCTDDSTMVIEVYAEPTALFYYTDDCLYNDPQFTDGSTVSDGNIATWQWNFGDAPVNQIQSSIASPTHHYLVDGSKDVTLIVETDKGCNDTIMLTTVRYPIPQVDFTFNPECEYDSIPFQNLTTLNAPDQITTWVWNYGDGSPLFADSVNSHLYAEEGDYEVTLIASSNHGCVDDTSHMIEVYPEPIALYSNTTVCENFNVTEFTSQSSVITGFLNGWQWDFEDVVNNESTLPNPSHDYFEDGIYNVQLVVKTDHDCFDTTSNLVTVLAKPTNAFEASITEACYPYCTDFTSQSISNATNISSYFWSFETEEDSYSEDNTVCFENLSHIETKMFDVTLITMNDLGCFDTLTKEDYITVWPKPLAVFEPLPPVTNMYLTEIDFENDSEGGFLYNWSFGDSSTSEEFDPSYIYKDTGHFVTELIVITEHECRDTTYRLVEVEPVLNVYIPNTFTPNGDGYNDDFFIKGYAIAEEGFTFMIFDRWGTLIYKTNQFKPWDGTYKGSEAQEDVYSYTVILNDSFGESHTYKGHVNLMR